MKQQRLPTKLFDYSYYDVLIDTYEQMKHQIIDNVFAKIYCEDLVVIYCARHLHYGFITKNPDKQNQNNEKVMDYIIKKDQNGKQTIRKINVEFGDVEDGYEIIKVLETQVPYWLQIVVQSHSHGILIMLTWDFIKNMEQNQFQIKINPNLDVGYHIVKGMNKKLNYFIDKNQLVDLEYGIPIRQVNVDQQLDISCVNYTKQVRNVNDYFNQRKIFIDNSRFLGIENAHCLYYPLCHMDLLIWQNVIALGASPDIIEQTIKLKNFNITVDGYSMFHHFADSPAVIEIIHAKIQKARDLGFECENDSRLPLQIICPDDDGKTALYQAVQTQCPICFECMVNLITDFKDYSLSKMVIESLVQMIEHDQEQVIDFFEYNIFRPVQMQAQQFVPWKEGMEEIIFASHTSIISKTLLAQKLEEQGIYPVEINFEAPKDDGANSKEECIRGKLPSELSEKKKILRDWNIHDHDDSGAADADNEGRQRVSVESLDMEWVFYNDNANKLLGMLASDANPKVLTRKSIRIYINLMWSYYQIAIIKFIFLPYIAYLMFLSQLTGKVAKDYVEFFYKDLTDESIKRDFYILQIKAYVLTLLCMSLMITFASLEVGQMIESGFGYFADYWNCIDSCSLVLNTIYLSMFTTCCIVETEFFSIEAMTTVGSFCCFFMWIKVFYWMRLFSALAYYVKLIQLTFVDSMPFILMVFIILAAFANFIYVENTNLLHEQPSSAYFQPYLGVRMLDVFISTYMLGMLGDFSADAYRTGYDRTYITVMFILATYAIQVVFMNMLIAIMGETFSKVSETSEENGLMEQVSLIADNNWLLDLQKIFDGKKFIIILTPGGSCESPMNETFEAIKDCEAQLKKRLNNMQLSLFNRVGMVDTNTSYQLKYQDHGINKIQKKIRLIERNQLQLQKQLETQMSPSTQPVKPIQSCMETRNALEKQKEELINRISSQNQKDPNATEQIQDIAMKWIEMVDKNKSGSLEFQEFADFCHKLDDLNYDEKEIRQVFEHFNESGTYSLSVEEFAKAIRTIFCTQPGGNYDDDLEVNDEDMDGGNYDSADYDKTFPFK